MLSQKPCLCCVLPWCQESLGNKFRKLKQNCLIIVLIFFLLLCFLFMFTIFLFKGRNSKGINVRFSLDFYTVSSAFEALLYEEERFLLYTQGSPSPWLAFSLSPKQIVLVDLFFLNCNWMANC